jgi:tripartite-type tricarboxylate transporter receptor subunit TctC
MKIVVLWLALAGSCLAQSYPSRPVHIVVPFAAGGGPDVQARQFGVKLAEIIRQPVVVENRVGAAGVLAAQAVMIAPPDGYLFLLGSPSPLLQKHLNPDLKFDPIADFAPAANLGSSGCVLVVRADHPARSVQELIELAKKNPGRLNYSSGGIGTAAHLAGATLTALEGLKTVHVPLKGSVEIAASLLRGDTDFACPVTGTGIPQVKAGKLRALGVTSALPLAELPGVPTLAEALKNELYIQEFWMGLWAPARTPAAVLRTIHAAVQKVQTNAELQQQFAAQGMAMAGSESPEVYAAFVRAENAKWGRVAKLSSAKSE